jgi:putative ABC transport system permease protein
MNVMRSFTLRSLSRNKKRTVVTIIGVVISAAMITAVTTFFASFLSLIQRDAIASDGNWHAVIHDVRAADLDVIEQSSDVSAAILNREVGCALINTSEDSGTNSKPYLFIQQYDAAGFDQMSVRLVSGHLPQSSSEVIVSQNLAKGTDTAYDIGDQITLEVGHRYMPDGTRLSDNSYYYYETNEDNTETFTEVFKPEQTMTFTVVGIMEAPSFEQSWYAGYGVLGYIDATALAPDDTVNVYMTMSPLSRSLYTTVSALAQQAGVSEDNVEYHDNLLRYSGVVKGDNVYNFIIGFAVVIIIIIMAASISLIYNAFAISVSERMRQLGLLSSVGATRRQKRASVYSEGFFIGAIGVPLGILAGIGGMAVTLAAIQPLLENFFNTSAGLRLTLVVLPAALIADVILSAVTIFISVWVPAKRASRITPIDAIRQTGEIRLTRKKLRTSRLTRALFGFEAEVALKNLKRNRKKYRATVVSLVISLVLFLTVSTYAQMTTFISGATNLGANFDIEVSYERMPDAARDNLSQQVQALDGITGYTRTASLYGYISVSEEQLTEYSKQYGSNHSVYLKENNFTVYVLCLDDNSFEKYAQAAGVDPADYADPKNPKAILINHGQDYITSSDGSMKKASGDILNVQAGDTFLFTAGDMPEEASNQPVKPATMEFTVGEVTEERPMGKMIQSFYTPSFVVSSSVFDTFIQSQGSTDISDYLGYSDFMTTSNDILLEKDLTELNARMQEGYYIYNIHSAARSEQSLSTFLGVFVYGFIILISLICIANIFNTVSTSIALRRREFAMLRSVGMTPGSFNRMVRFESIFYGLKGLMWGLPISVLIGWVLYRLQLSVLSSGFTLPWISYGVGVLMILVIVFSTMMYATHRIKKENIIDALKEENI